jgi:hypothetical protein
VELHVAGQNAPMRLDTADICVGGCYLETMFTMAVGTALDAVLWLGEKKFTTRAEIVTCHPQFGNGLKFLGLAEAEQKTLQAYLDSLPDAE